MALQFIKFKLETSLLEEEEEEKAGEKLTKKP
jgi:hypothetical protein